MDESRRENLNFDVMNGRNEVPNPVLEEDQNLKLEAELLRHRRACGHVSFAKLQLMEKKGKVPKRLATCRTRAFSACLCSVIAKKGWRKKTRKEEKEQSKESLPEDRVSVDMLVLPTQGFIAQMASLLTKKRHEHATVYVDQA